jgi:hybrid cluster-associated redox disulfide protein
MGRKSKAKAKAKISKEMNLGELVQTYPKLAEVLAEDYGLHCVGCFAAEFDSLEQGAKIHGYDDKEIEEMVRKLNKLVGA